MFKETHVADKTDRVKFKGTLTNWPEQNQTQHNKTHAEQALTNIQHELCFWLFDVFKIQAFFFDRNIVSNIVYKLC